MVLDTYADIARSFTFVEERAGALGNRVRVRRAPVGVVRRRSSRGTCRSSSSALKLGPALAAGCTMVLKPAPETPLDAYLLAEAIDEVGLPPGVINICAAGRENSEYLVRHPGIDKVSFTGSTVDRRQDRRRSAASRSSAARSSSAASRPRSCSTTSTSTARCSSCSCAALMNNGQACGAQTRILAPRSRYAEIVDALAGAVGAMKLGDPLDPDDEHRAGRERSASATASRATSTPARRRARRAVVGGGRPKALPKGWYIEPTVFADVDNSMKIAQEEIFGPVLVGDPLRQRGRGDRASPTTRTTACAARSGRRTSSAARRLAARVRTGCVAVNSAMILDFRSPFGGFKKSGIGRELGPEGIGGLHRVPVDHPACRASR